MRSLASKTIAVALAVVTVTAIQSAVARTQRPVGHEVKFPSGELGLQPGSEVTLYGWTKKAEPFLAGKASQTTFTPLGVKVNGTMYGGFLSDEFVTESKDKTVDYYFALSSMRSPIPGKTLTVELDGYKGLNVIVGYRTDLGGTVAPIKASRTKSGDGIIFTYKASTIPISTPASSTPPTEWAVICTNSKTAPQWGIGRAIVSVDGTVQRTFDMVAPQPTAK